MPSRPFPLQNNWTEAEQGTSKDCTWNSDGLFHCSSLIWKVTTSLDTGQGAGQGIKGLFFICRSMATSIKDMEKMFKGIEKIFRGIEIIVFYF